MLRITPQTWRLLRLKLFSDRDQKLIEDLEFDETLTASFEALKGCLIWEDERPDGLTSEGYECLCDLWIARSFIHRNLPSSDWGLDSDHFQRIWNEALKAKIDWPGFKRLKLNDGDRRYLEMCLKEQNQDDPL